MALRLLSLPRATCNALPQLGKCSKFTTPTNCLQYNKYVPNYYILNRANFLNTKIIETTEKDGIFSRIGKKIARKDLTKQKLRTSAYVLYEGVVDVIDYSGWFKEFKLDDTFLSWFVITELHIWMMMVRAMAIPENGEFLRNCLVKALWADVEVRVKKLGPSSSKLIRSQLQIYSEQFNAAIIGYDEGMLSGDIVLAGAIWRRFFQMNCNDPIIVEKLVKYLREQISELDKISDTQYIMQPKVNWISLVRN